MSNFVGCLVVQSEVLEGFFKNCQFNEEQQVPPHQWQRQRRRRDILEDYVDIWREILWDFLVDQAEVLKSFLNKFSVKWRTADTNLPVSVKDFAGITL